jgi:hypothetical protein
MIYFNNIEELKIYAKEQLTKTDYAVLPDVYLINKDEFINYRATLRQAIMFPNLTMQFPQEPKANWNNN